MQDLPVRNIFLPATLVASAVFIGLTAPAAFLQPSNSAFSRVPLLNQAARIDFDHLHKDIAIPFIGTTIMLSAGAGIATAEIVRKRLSAQQEVLGTPVSDEFSFAEKATASSNLVSELPLVDETFRWPTAEGHGAVSAETPEAVETDLFDGVSGALWSPAAAAGTWAHTASNMDEKVIVFPGQYQRCRIQIPQRQEQLYAIEFNEQFYSLLSAGIPKEDALSAVEQLTQEKRVAILTRMNQGYAVWVLESEAQRIQAA